MRFFTASIVAALAALASAWTQPNYNNPPAGNPILTPGLNQQVPVGQPFDITWTPTTSGTVTLVLLRGPSNNAVALYPIAQEIENTGTFSWTPSTSLQNDDTHYGLLLVVDATRAYQYSTQFGISNPNSPTSASGTVTTGSSTTTGTASCQSCASLTITTLATIVPLSSPSGTPATSTVTLVGTGKSSVPFVSPTKTPYLPSTLISTLTSTIPSSTPVTTPTPTPSANTNAAGRSTAHMGGVGVVAGLIALLAF